MENMRIGVSAYSYYKLIGAGKMELIDTIEAAKETGFDIIEFITLPGETKEERLELARTLKERAAEVGIEINAYAVGAELLYGGATKNVADEVAKLKEEVEIAQALGVDRMRHDVAHGIDYEQDPGANYFTVLDRLAEPVREVTEFAAERGIKTMTENHGFFSQDSDRVEALIEAVDHPNFGALVDMGNFLCADEDPVSAVDRLLSYAFHVHAKDFIFKAGQEISPGAGWITTRSANYLRGTVIGHGVVPVYHVVQMLKHRGYSGDLSIEFEGWEDPSEAIPASYAYLRSCLGD